MSHRIIHVASFSNMFKVRLRPQLKELYAFTMLFSFAYALIFVFEPVFFYQEGFSLSFIALYYALHYSLYSLVLPYGGKFAARYGVERSLGTSLPFFIAYFATLASIPYNHKLIWIAIVLLTLHKIFYWPAYHADFAKHSESGNMGTELSWMRLISFGIGVLGPIIGGVIAARLGFPVLFIVTACLVFLSAIPMLRTKEQYRPVEFPYSAPWNIILSRRHRNMVRAMMGMGENLIDMVWWPVFMFITVGSTTVLGFISSINLAIMSGVSFFIGEVSDRMSRSRVLRLHLPFMVMGYLLRPFAATPLRVFFIDAFCRIAYAGVTLPMVYRLYRQAGRAGIIRYTVAFELVLAMTKAVVAFALVGVFAWMLPYPAFVVTFVAAGIFSLMYAFL